jgi:hypothetical protein
MVATEVRQVQCCIKDTKYLIRAAKLNGDIGNRERRHFPPTGTPPPVFQQTITMACSHITPGAVLVWRRMCPPNRVDMISILAAMRVLPTIIPTDGVGEHEIGQHY